MKKLNISEFEETFKNGQEIEVLIKDYAVLDGEFPEGEDPYYIYEGFAKLEGENLTIDDADQGETGIDDVRQLIEDGKENVGIEIYLK